MGQDDLAMRAEKLGAAVYMVTDFFSDNEPLKWQLRSLSVSFISAVHSFSSPQTQIGSIISLMRLAAMVNLVSDMNATIIIREYFVLKDILKDNIKLPVLDDTAKNMIEKPLKDRRQELITSLLRERRSATISDICEVMKDCSPKTVQRELLRMISRGVVSRRGDRRWSRYFLVSGP